MAKFALQAMTGEKEKLPGASAICGVKPLWCVPAAGGAAKALTLRLLKWRPFLQEARRAKDWQRLAVARKLLADTYRGISKERREKGIPLLTKALDHCRKRATSLEKVAVKTWWRSALDFLGGAAIATGICAVYR